MQGSKSGIERNRGVASEGSEMYSGGQRPLHRYDGALLREPRGVQAPPGASGIALPGIGSEGCVWLLRKCGKGKESINVD